MCQTCGGAGIVEGSEGKKCWEDCPECGGKPMATPRPWYIPTPISEIDAVKPIGQAPGGIFRSLEM